MLLLAVCLSGCTKSFLSPKPNTNIVIPDSLSDFEGLLNNNIMTQTAALPILSADEYYYASYASWEAAYTATERNAYIWADDLYSGEDPIDDWNAPYEQIFYANVVLAGLTAVPITANNTNEYSLIKGWAYFARGFALYNLVSEFAPLYDSNTAAQDPGVPIRLTADVNVIAPRSPVRDCYAQVLADLTQAGIYLPLYGPPSALNVPSKVALWALYARIYLSIGNYTQAQVYADSCLLYDPSLMNYNTLDTSSVTPISTINPETIIFYTAPYQYPSTLVGAPARSTIDTALYQSYDANDLRKHLYFFIRSGNVFMKKGYTGNTGGVYPFTGLATDEVYLIKAECQARADSVAASLQTLNTLLATRYATGTFVPYTVSSAQLALSLIWTERKKELVWRGLRWADLKRFNKEGQNLTLVRNLSGQTYTLPPRDLRYVLPIPQYEIDQSGITQNPR
jgi:tetratricopeptide (TPR) repeat protein